MNKRRPKNIKSILFFLITDIITVIAVVVIGFILFRDYAIQEHIRMAEGLTGLVADVIDADRTLEYIEKGHEAPGYDETAAEIRRLMDAYPDVKYLYVTRIQSDGCYVVFDMATEDAPGADPGTVVGYEDAFLPYIDDLLAGRGVKPIISNDQYGYLLTVYSPAVDSNGVCQCYAAADFSMDTIGRYTRDFIWHVVLFLVGFSLLTFIARILFIDRRLFRPMKKMDTIAHRDALTGLQNKTAYDEAAARIDKNIISGNAAFTIVVVDVNFLKRVNDTYGHEQGNAYLIANSRAIAQVFGEDNVYRIGGDEFAVILDADASKQPEKLIEAYKRMRSDGNDAINDWKRISAAIGMASYNPETDHNTDAVFKRADASMYQDKVAMKAERKD
jgi:diguanylate cyclase (GGDEF)-like protein